jgi:hypothetical protein
MYFGLGIRIQADSHIRAKKPADAASCALPALQAACGGQFSLLCAETRIYLAKIRTPL